MGKKGFSLVEILIVMSILGILAALVIPAFSDNSTEAKEAAAKDNLRIFRSQIELYSSRNTGIPPGYPGNNTGATPTETALIDQLVTTGQYINTIPENPFNGSDAVSVVTTAPAGPSGTEGWIYYPPTKTLKLNYAGNDSDGNPYWGY